MSVTPEQVEAGQAVYTRRMLAVYDVLVLGVSNRFIWKCPTAGLLDHYNRYVSANHLDVGVGTGYFLDRCRFPSPTPRVALMDLNPESLAFASRRLARYRPDTYRRNILEPIPFKGRPFDSVGLNYVFHCLPGAIETKAVVLDHLTPLLNAGAVVFGSTLLRGGVERSWIARRLMAFYNKQGIFSNRRDDLEGLKRALSNHLKEVSVEVRGCAAIFVGRL